MHKVNLFKKFKKDVFRDDLKYGDSFTRGQIADWLNGEGYADQSIMNMLFPSNKKGLIKPLLDRGAISKDGLKKWIYNGDDALEIAASLSKVHFKNRKKAVKLYKGSPCELDGWETEIGLGDPGVMPEWGFSYIASDNGKYINAKVFCVGECEHKANYQVSVNRETWRIVPSESAALLKEHRPNLLENLLSDLQDINRAL